MTPPPRPAAIPDARHLRLFFHDIIRPIDEHVPPADEHVLGILDFVQRWDRRAPLLIHCWAGISRSTAAAFMTACALNPAVDEALIAEALRAASPTATPNPLMVQIADDLMGRGGRMITAIDDIGIGEMATEGRPFRLDIPGASRRGSGV
jgi:predicted protein tyrosine phosphatase